MKANTKPVVVSYTLAAVAGISFVCGLALLASETSLCYGPIRLYYGDVGKDTGDEK